jgi:hypothetical protein
MADSNLAYAFTGTATHKLGAKQVGTESGLPVTAERVQLEPGETVKAGQKTVPTVTAEALVGSATPLRAGGLLLVAFPTNAHPVFWGPSGVTTSTGCPLYPGRDVVVAIDDAVKLFVIAANASQVVGWGGTA